MAMKIEEQLSALVDGELTDREMNEVLASLRSQPGLRERWARYHLISDGMHKGLPGQLKHDLQARVTRAIATEPVILAPVRKPHHPMNPRVKQAVGIAMAACVTAVAILGFQNMDAVQFPWMAEAPPESLTAADNDLAPYLMNHNEYVASASYGMLPYIRLVSHSDAESESE